MSNSPQNVFSYRRPHPLKHEECYGTFKKLVRNSEYWLKPRGARDQMLVGDMPSWLQNISVPYANFLKSMPDIYQNPDNLCPAFTNFLKISQGGTHLYLG